MQATMKAENDLHLNRRSFLRTSAAVAGGLLVSLAAAQTQRQRPGRGADDMPRQGNLHVGDLAPDFALKTKEGDRAVKLSTFRGKRPVVLVFGSYT